MVAARAAARQGKACAQCTRSFVATRSDAIYCGSACGQRAHYLANRAEAIARASRWAKANPEARRAASVGNKRRRRDAVLASPGVSARDWRRLVNRYRGCCAYCGVRPVVLHMEHVVPFARGGRHSIGNVLPACPGCNGTKSALLLVEWRYRNT